MVGSCAKNWRSEIVWIIFEYSKSKQSSVFGLWVAKKTWIYLQYEWNDEKNSRKKKQIWFLHHYFTIMFYVIHSTSNGLDADWSNLNSCGDGQLVPTVYHRIEWIPGNETGGKTAAPIPIAIGQADKLRAFAQLNSIATLLVLVFFSPLIHIEYLSFFSLRPFNGPTSVTRLTCHIAF